MIVLWTWDLKEELYILRVQELKCTTTQNNLRQKTTCSCFSYTVLSINKCSFFICHEITIQVHMYWNLTGSTLTLGRSGLTFNIHNHMTILAEVFQHIGHTYFNIQSKLSVFSWNYNESFFSLFTLVDKFCLYLRIEHCRWHALLMDPTIIKCNN